MQRNLFFGLVGIFVCLLMGGCYTAGRCPGGGCSAPGAAATPTYEAPQGTLQGSGARPQPNYPAPMFQGSGTR